MQRHAETILSVIGITCLLVAIAWTYNLRNECLDKGGVYITAQWMCIKAEVLK